MPGGVKAVEGLPSSYWGNAALRDGRGCTGLRLSALCLAVAVSVVLFGLNMTAWAAEPGPFERGLEYFGRGEYSDAEAAFRDAVAADPTSARAYYFLGLSASKLGKTSEAADSLEEALSLDPELSEAYLLLGIARHKLRQYEQAAQALDEAIERVPQDANALFLRGLAEQALGRYQSSVPYFEKAMAVDPDYTQLAFYNIGLAYHRAGEDERAKDAFKQAVTVDPESDTAKHAQSFIDRIAAAEKTEKKKRPWSVSAQAGIEFDDNVTREELNGTTSEGDGVALFDFSGSYRFLDGPELSLEAGYDFSQSVYESLTNFNLHSHSGSLGAKRKWGDVTFGLNYQYTRTLLGGFDFLGLHNLRPNVLFPVSSAWYVSASYNLEGKDFRRSGDADRDAIQHGAAIDNFLFFNNQKSYLLAGYLLESENANGPQFDYLAQTGEIKLKTPLEFFDPDLTLRVGYRFRHRDYSNVTASIGSERLENRHTALLRLSYEINDYVELELQYRYVNSISNLRTSDFTRNLIGFSVGFQY